MFLIFQFREYNILFIMVKFSLPDAKKTQQKKKTDYRKIIYKKLQEIK